MIKKNWIHSISEELKAIKEIDFALLFGSSFSKPLNQCRDIDIGVYLEGPVTLKLIADISEIVENHVKKRCDLSILNTASEILRFQALKGKLLFVREDKLEAYSTFYSLTCREYEDKIVWMKRQLLYRGYA